MKKFKWRGQYGEENGEFGWHKKGGTGSKYALRVGHEMLNYMPKLTMFI